MVVAAVVVVSLIPPNPHTIDYTKQKNTESIKRVGYYCVNVTTVLWGATKCQ